MSDIHECATAIDKVILRAMVTEVGGDIHIGNLRSGIEEGIACTTADGHGAHGCPEITGDTHTMSGGRKGPSDQGAELLEGQGR